MATHTAARAKHATLAAATVDTVTLSADSQLVEVSNWGGDRIYFTVNGVDPTVAGDDTYVVGPGGSLVVPTVGPASEAYKLISAGTPSYTVQAVYASRAL